MRTLIVDDEPLARARLKRLLAQQPGIVCVGEASSAEDALMMVKKLTPDLILLDIEMPGTDGLEFAEQLGKLAIPPAVVFVTAHAQHALEAYKVAPAGYILKPVSAERLAASLQLLGKTTRVHLGKQLESESFIVYQLAGVVRQIALSKVWFFSAEDKYVRMSFEGGSALLEQSLVQLELKYSNQLVRIHRSTLINKAKFSQLQHLGNGEHCIILEGCPVKLDVSRRALSKIRQQLNLV